MINRNSGINVYLSTNYIDMRKSIDGLTAIVQLTFDLDPFSTALFVFCNKNKDKIKILQWEQNGFWLHYKRLEKGRFKWPENIKGETLTISSRELNWLLDGLNLEQKQAHKKVHSSLVI